ncbi:MAG: hypothetical protein R3B04_12125 [Nitrospira sp.]
MMEVQQKELPAAARESALISLRLSVKVRTSVTLETGRGGGI